LKKVIIFTDSGIDDAIALTLAVKSCQLEILGIFVSQGNVGVDKGIRNAELILNLLKVCQKPPIFAGRSISDNAHLPDVQHIHGHDGLGNITRSHVFSAYLGSPRIYPIETFYQILHENQGEVTIITLSPLTDLAICLKELPDIGGAIERIVIMGGAIYRKGNITENAEFNFFCNPRAADAVLSSGLPILLVPLDITEELQMNESHLERIALSSFPLRRALGEMLRRYYEFHRKYRNFLGCYVHDPLAVGVCINEGIIKEVRKLCVAVETKEGPLYGKTREATDLQQVRGRPQVEVVFEVDKRVFLEYLISTLCRE